MIVVEETTIKVVSQTTGSGSGVGSGGAAGAGGGGGGGIVVVVVEGVVVVLGIDKIVSASGEKVVVRSMLVNGGASL